MAGSEERSQQNFQRQIDERRFVIPLSAQFAGSSLERVFSSIHPLVLPSSDNPLRSYARRFFPQNHSVSTNHQQIGRNNIVRPHISDIVRSQNNSNIFPSHTSSPESQVVPSASNPTTNSESVSVQNVVINIDLEPYNVQSETMDGSNSDAAQMPQSNDDHNQLGTLSIDSRNLEEFIGRNQDLRISIKSIWQYLVFICIVLLKLLFDKITNIFVLVFLSIIFAVGDKVVRKNATYQNRSLKSIVAVIVITPLSIYLLYRIYNKENFFYSAILLFPEYNLLTLGDLLWIVIVTDLILKIVTVMSKSFVVLLPRTILSNRRKANVYALLERISRFYRSLATIQPWMAYFLDGYVGPKKIFGIFLSAFYMICKGPEIISRIKELRIVFSKLLFSSAYGTNPSQSQMDEAGSRCPICHDEFTSPLRLSCTHIFCESCVLTWFTKERTCPMCRTNIMTDDPAYRDGSTSYLPQIY